jgi:hypothetical protein
VFVHFQIVNPQTGEQDSEGYADAQEVIYWNKFVGPDGGARKLRGKVLTNITFKNGLAWWTEEAFRSVSWRILLARGDKEQSDIERQEHLLDQQKSSPLTV